jgi:hypothetical protein
MCRHRPIRWTRYRGGEKEGINLAVDISSKDQASVDVFFVFFFHLNANLQ